MLSSSENSAHRAPRRALTLVALILALLTAPTQSLALRTTFLARITAPLAPLASSDMWSGARASTAAPDPTPVSEEAIAAARLRAAGHAHLHRTVASIARKTTTRLDGVKAPLTVAYRNNVLPAGRRLASLWRREAAPALCLEDPNAVLVLRP